MKTLGVCANTGKPRVREVLQRIAGCAAELGMALVVDPDTAALEPSLPPTDIAELADAVDAVIALGGDGTLLSVVHSMRGAETPVLGVNIGGLGFLTSVAEREIDDAMQCLAAGRMEVSRSPILKADVTRGDGCGGTYYALNEIVVARGPTSRMIQINVHINGEAVTTYSCDGILVSTPVGSTGYSLSSGGPILVPGTPSLVITLICPHTLGSRPMVVPEDSAIAICPDGGEQDLLVSADGQTGQVLQAEDSVCIRRSRHTARLLHLPGHSFFTLLRQKLHWRGSNIR